MSPSNGRGDPAATLPLTSAQLGVWYGQRTAETPAIYNTARWVSLAGAVDTAVLADAVTTAVGEADSLNMRFDAVGEHIGQTPQPAAVAVQQVDVSGSADPPAAAEEWMSRDVARPLDPTSGKLVRTALVRVGPDHLLWYLCCHHIAVDAHGFTLVQQRVAQLYTDFLRGRDRSASPFGTIRTLLTEEAEYLQSPDFAADRDFWLRRFADRPSVVTFAGRAAAVAPQPMRQSTSLPRDATQRLRARGKAVRAVWPEVLVAALAAFVRASTGAGDVTLGLPRMTRSSPAQLRVPATVANVLPVRLAGRADESPDELIKSTMEEMRTAGGHQRYRVEQLQRDLGLLGAGRRLVGPLVNIKPPAPELSFGSVPATVHYLAAGPVEDLTLTAYSTGDEIQLDFDANPRKYDERSLAVLRERFLAFLGHFTTTDVAVPCMGATARAAPQVDSPDEAGERTLAAVFAEQARGHPERSALAFEGTRYSYAELDRRSNRLARRLIAAGVRPGVFVALGLRRSADLITAVLGVLKAGGAYLPLELEHPDERLALLVEDARPAWILTNRQHAGRFPAGGAVLQVDDPGFRDELDALPDHAVTDEDRAAPLTPRSPAYVIHTSGSTGAPKGVVVEHRNVVRLFSVTRGWFDFGPDDVWTLFHSHAFDFSVWEIWGAFAHGGRLVVVPEAIARSPRDFLRLLVDEEVTVLNQTPSAFQQLTAADVEEPALGDRLVVRTAILGGERLDPARLAPWFDRHPDTAPELVNMYGITETTVHATAHRVHADEALGTTRSVIGQPLADVRVRLLDEHGDPVSAGVAGEMHVGGAGVAQGYLGRPALTAERFLPDPLGPPGARLYASGDLARWTAEGELEHLGRIDEQVSLRGHRIEPGEIVTAALGSDGVADVAVVVDERPNDERRLVCYAVPVAGAALRTGDLRRELSARLPAYMVPAAVVAVDRLPLTANGKLDRAGLPAATGASEDALSAVTPTEQVLCGLFAEVLGIASPGVDEDFFERGGHSVLATKLIGRVRAVLGAELDIRAVFAEPTPGQLAHRLERATRPRLLPLGEGTTQQQHLSSAQQRLWFLARMEGPGALYNLPLAVTLRGTLDESALRRALADIVERHETLRSVFPEHLGIPQQSIRSTAEATPDLPIVESSPGSLDAQLRAEAQRGFDLANEAPLRAVLFRTGEHEHVLLLCLHHIAGDAASLHPIVSDLGAAYVARARGETPNWQPITVRYADYTRWQEELLGDERDPDSVVARELSYWRRALAGLPDRLELPTDRPRAANPSYRGGQVPLVLDEPLADQMRALADRHGASLFMVLHAALVTLLHRLGAGTDIPIGAPVAGRTDEALQDLVGFFVNTLVLRTDVGGDPSFAELLARVRETDLGAYAHQETPFDRVVGAANPPRSPERHPLFQVMLSVANPPDAAQWGTRLTAELVPVPTATEKFDLTVNLSETAGRGPITGSLEYATDLFDADTISAFANKLARVVRAGVADPEQRLSRIPILGAAERDRIVREWNDTAAPISPRTLPEMVQDQVAATPDAAAVVFAGLVVTYDDLNRWSNRLAHHLTSLGVGRERTVGVHMRRGIEQVVGLLAVLKAGGAFVPLDTAWPAGRVTEIAECAQLTAILAHADTAAGLSAVTMPVVEVDEVDLAECSEQDPERAVSPNDIAYVIYTSGTTGAPKGAMLTHIAVSNRLPWQVDLLGLDRTDAVLYKAPLSFDISVNEIFLPLISGARLVAAEPDGEKDFAGLLGLIATQRVTFIYLVSTMLELMLERDDFAERARSLRHVWCGGDVLTPQLYQRFRSCLDATMYHGYGPAETTIGVSCQVYHGADPGHGITIGRPNPNNQLYLLDEHMNPVPVGVAGEIHVGGVQLARGYIGDPVRTAEKFVPDPFSGRAGASLYVTGDLAKYQHDGNIAFLGRRDNQVKIHGMRVEPEELEAVLAAHPDVRQAVVLVREDAAAGKHLSAYCTPYDDGELDREHLHQWVGDRVPQYMVPAEITILGSFPLMASGKIDRNALRDVPEYQPVRALDAGTYREPAAGMQQKVAAVWSRVLGIADIGADDNFFDLGGHSLLLTKVQTALERELGHGIAIVELFTHTSVETLAAHLKNESSGSSEEVLDMLLPIRPEGTEPPVFCLHPASGLAWPFAALRKHIGDDIPIYGIQAHGLNGSRAVPDTLDELAREYLDVIRSTQPTGPYRLVGWSFGGVAAHRVASMLQADGHQVQLLSMLDAYPAYPWEKLADDHEQQALRSLLYMSHYDLSTLPDQPLDRATVLRTVSQQGGVLAELPPAAITAIMNTFVNSARLQQESVLETFAGDVLFFTATVNPIDSALTHKNWLEHVAGTVENIDISCEHKDMTQAGPISIIGSALDERLRP